MTRKEIYKRILERALAEIYAELEEMGFDTDNIDTSIKIRNYEFNEQIVVKDVELNVCEDVDSVDYGKITKVKVMLSKNVDKSGNILVSPIIIGKIDEKSDDLKADGLRTGIAEAIGVKEEVVQIVFS